MVILFNIRIKKTEKCYKAFRQIFGIGKKRSIYLCKLIGLSEVSRVEQIDLVRMRKLKEVVAFLGFEIGIDLRRELDDFISKSKEIRSYRGLRRQNCLPVNGQRTKTNAKTVKSKKKN